MKYVIKEIEKNELLNFLYDITLTDKNIYDEINNTNYLGIFQMNGGSAEKLVKQIHPDNFNELVAINALARPGTIEFASEYGKNKIEGTKHYQDDIVNNITKETYTLPLYQEQAMSIFNVVGDFDPDETNCIVGDTLITTDKGQISIKEIVEKKLDVKILTFNEKNNNLEWKNIIYYFNNGKKELIEIEFENNKKISCTKEHKFYTKNRGWVEAQFLTIEDELFHISS